MSAITIDITTEVAAPPSDAAIVVPLFAEESVDDLPRISDLQRRHLAAAVRRGARPSKLYEPTLLFGEDGGHDVLILGAGERSDMDGLGMLRLAASASRYLSARGFPHLILVDRGVVSPWHFAYAVVVGAISGAYNVGLRKSRDEAVRKLESLTLLTEETRSDEARDGGRVGGIVGGARNIARDLVNRPPNEMTPLALAERAEQLAAECGLGCEILDEAAMGDLGMGSMLGVSQGSEQPARIVVLRYGDEHAATKLAVVGKGLTFDSGGLSLKTHEGMETMKCDMSGAAAVVAGMVAVAQLAPRGISVTGYIGAAENMPSGASMRPGDVLTAMNGKTIEVLNTDAEGRLVLADVLAYAVRQGATHIVDLATLTGAAMVSLGSAASLATGRPADWVNRVVAAADDGLDRSWAMPQYREYREAMDSEVADLKNTGGRGGGALNAAAFLSDFVGDVPWTHLDIAGTAFESDAKPYRSTGATGVGVGAIVGIVRELSKGR